MALPAALPKTLCPDCHRELWLDVDWYRMTIGAATVTMHFPAACTGPACGLQLVVSHTWVQGADGPEVLSCLVVALRSSPRWQVDPDGNRYLPPTRRSYATARAKPT